MNQRHSHWCKCKHDFDGMRNDLRKKEIMVGVSMNVKKKKKCDEYKKVLLNHIKSLSNNSDNNGEKYTKIRVNSDDDLPLRTLEFGRLIIVVKSAFHQSKNTVCAIF